MDRHIEELINVERQGSEVKGSDVGHHSLATLHWIDLRMGKLIDGW